jgi:hypothetical protein
VKIEYRATFFDGEHATVTVDAASINNGYF